MAHMESGSRLENLAKRCYRVARHKKIPPEFQRFTGDGGKYCTLLQVFADDREKNSCIFAGNITPVEKNTVMGKYCAGYYECRYKSKK